MLYDLQGLLTDTALYCVVIIMMILQVPSLVEKMVSGTPPKHPSLSQESLGLLLKRPWDPIGNALTQQKLVRFFLSFSVLTVRISQWDRMRGLCLHSQDCIVSPQSQQLHYINYYGSVFLFVLWTSQFIGHWSLSCYTVCVFVP